jgi:Rieske Fe-S protein
MPPRQPDKTSKYTADRRIPGSFEGETVTRRRFMSGSANVFGGAAVAAFTLPALGFALGPVFEEREQSWLGIGPIDRIPDDTYVPRVFTEQPDTGEAGKTTTYVRRRNEDIDLEPADEYNQVVALSTNCMHLGCPIRFVEASGRFICPCHGGVYGFRGEVTGGPPVRPLDRFYTRVRGGQVEVGPRYSVNSELDRFSPRYPGQDLDGIGQYVYPSRPTARKLPED